MRVFCKPSLRCVGRLDGTPCPHAFEVDLASPDAEAKLQFLHLDHERPVRRTCERWSNALPESPASWHNGLDGGALCHDLFGAYDDEQYGGKCLRFRSMPTATPSDLCMYFGRVGSMWARTGCCVRV